MKWAFFFDSDPQINAMQKRFEENLDKVSERMTYYRSASPYVENVYAYSSRMDRLVGSTKSTNEKLLLSSAWRAAVAGSDGKRNIRVFFQRWNNQYPYRLTLIRDMTGKNGVTTGYVMVDVNIEKLGALVLGNFPDKENARLFIVDKTGQMILSTPYYLLGDRDTLPDELQEYASVPAGYSQTIELDGSEYVVSCQDSTQENWRYILLRPYDRYFSLASRGEWIFSLMVTLVLVMALLVVLMIVFTTFRPLNRIITAIEEPAAAPSSPARQSRGMQEVERIIQSVTDLRLTNTAMQSQLNEKMHEFSLEQVRALRTRWTRISRIMCWTISAGSPLTSSARAARWRKWRGRFQNISISRCGAAITSCRCGTSCTMWSFSCSCTLTAMPAGCRSTPTFPRTCWTAACSN